MGWKVKSAPLQLRKRNGVAVGVGAASGGRGGGERDLSQHHSH